MKKNLAGTNPSIVCAALPPQPATPPLNTGETNGNHRLTAAQVLAIYANQDETSTALAERYGVTQQAISLIRQGKRWAWLTQRPAGERAA